MILGEILGVETELIVMIQILHYQKSVTWVYMYTKVSIIVVNYLPGEP